MEGTIPLRDGGYCSLVLWWRVPYSRVMVEGTVPLCYNGGCCALALWLKSSSGGSRIRENERKSVRLKFYVSFTLGKANTK